MLVGLARVSASALVLTLAAAGAARAADPPPLRTLAYDVTYSLQTTQDVKISGLTGGNPHGLEAGNASVSRGATQTDRGTLKIDVVAAPADGTLVVDASYAGREAKQPPVRVVIFSDGALSYDPKYLLSPPARQVLPLLARGLLAERDVAPGATWTAPVPKPAQGTLTYRVAHADAARATLAIVGDAVIRGPNGFEEHDDVTTTYATDVLCPISVDGRQRMRRQTTSERTEIADSRVTATLLSDSFAKKP
jgi:hypothetical protein